MPRAMLPDNPGGVEPAVDARHKRQDVVDVRMAREQSLSMLERLLQGSAILANLQGDAIHLAACQRLHLRQKAEAKVTALGPRACGFGIFDIIC